MSRETTIAWFNYLSLFVNINLATFYLNCASTDFSSYVIMFSRKRMIKEVCKDVQRSLIPST